MAPVLTEAAPCGANKARVDDRELSVLRPTR